VTTPRQNYGTYYSQRLIVPPAFLASPSPSLSFGDQFAFRPAGSSTAALITLLQSITSWQPMRRGNRDRLKHSILCVMLHCSRKWQNFVFRITITTGLSTFFLKSPSLHEVQYMAVRCRPCSICIVHGSAIGPACYVVNSADLTTQTSGRPNVLRKYADDTVRCQPSTSDTWHQTFAHWRMG